MSYFVLSPTFGENPEKNFGKVAEDILMLVQKRIPGTPPAGVRPIICDIWDEDYPITITQKGYYDIRLTTDPLHRRYAQFTYQLAHELGHVMMGTLRTNGLVETLATLLSHQILEDMAEKWKTSPPYPDWLDYAPSFLTYVQDMQKKRITKFPLMYAAVETEDWELAAAYMHQRKVDQIANPYDRDLNAIGAILLHNTDFKKDSTLWAELRGVAWCTNPPPPAEDAYHIHATDKLELEMDMLPSKLRESFGRWLGY